MDQNTGFFSNRAYWLAGIFLLLLLGLVYTPSISYLIKLWVEDENFSHGFFIPAISLYLIWQKRHALLNTGLQGSWWGVPVMLAGFGLYILGELATLYILLHLSFLIVVVGLILSVIGWRGVREIAFPLVFLVTMIRPPDFFLQSLSAELQLISSQLAVNLDQMIGITVFREGNVIDFGTIQLQVAEACSGLRYLFPLATMALIVAYLYQDKQWKRMLIFLSSIPISIFLNGFRIAATGFLVDQFGEGPAEGFFHGFSGWLLFVTGLAFLFMELALLGGVFNKGKQRSFFELFQLKPVQSRVCSADEYAFPFKLKLSAPYFVSVGLLVPLVIFSFVMVSRQEEVPSRTSFYDFPMALSGWKGKTEKLEPVYVETLKFDDYILADYRLDKGSSINFYSAYYNSQKKGQSAHSPRTCIPGGGWEITSLKQMEISDLQNGLLTVNRAIIQKGDQKQVVFYWFQQRGRTLTNEYLVKFYLFWDAFAKNRTDGALVRLTSLVSPGEDESAADSRLASFAHTIYPILGKYIPG